MFDHLQLAYLGLEVPDPDGLAEFLTDVVGLAAGTPIGPIRTLRNDAAVHRLLLRAGPANDATVVGFEAPHAEILDVLAEQLTALGAVVEAGTDEQCEQRRVERMVRTAAPWGTEIELVVGLARGPVDTPLVPAGFHTDDLGFGHVVFGTTAYDDAQTFLIEGLGFRQSDWLQMEIAAGIELEVRFFHCNPRHHTVALARAPFELPQRLHHVMFEVEDRDDVGAAFDRAWASGQPLPNGLGRHDNDHMFSFYVASPAGFLVEVGYGAREVSPDWSDNRRYDRISMWGHQPLR